jgi:hypothetical protein
VSLAPGAGARSAGHEPPASSASACPNCGAPVAGRYCSSCGQRQGDVRVSIGRMTQNALEDQLSVDATLPRTLFLLFFRPGHLTREYTQLRIARYVAPFRLYLISSVLFFLTLSFVSGVSRADVQRAAAAIEEERARVDSARAAAGAAQSGRLGITIEDVGGDWLESVSVNFGSARLNRAVEARIERLGGLPPEEALNEMTRSFLDQVPKVMFLLLPVYALLLKLLYVRGDRFYAEHFVFALHVHAFTFLLFFVALVLRGVPHVSGLLLLWLPPYTLLAMKHFYGQGWLRTSLKWMALGHAYALVLAAGMVLGILMAVLSV